MPAGERHQGTAGWTHRGRWAGRGSRLRPGADIGPIDPDASTLNQFLNRVVARFAPAPSVVSMSMLSANHSFLLARTEYPLCAVFLLRDPDRQRVYRLYDFTKAQLIRPNVAYCVAGKVNSAAKLYLVVESVRLDTRHGGHSTVPVPADRAGGRTID